MKKKNKKITSAALAFGVSMCVLAGSVYAWWTSNDTFAGSNLETGRAEVEIGLYIFDVPDEGEPEWKEDNTAKITVEDMIPGDSRFYAVQVKNTSRFIGTPNLTVKAVSDAQEKHIKDYKFDPEPLPGAFKLEDTYMLSKMMILNIDAVIADNYLDLANPTAHDTSSTSTAEDQTEAVEDSIYEKTDGITEDYVESALDNDDEKVQVAPNDSIFFIIEFHFSGAAGNAYQETRMTMEKIIIGIDQTPDSQII